MKRLLYAQEKQRNATSTGEHRIVKPINKPTRAYPISDLYYFLVKANAAVFFFATFASYIVTSAIFFVPYYFMREQLVPVPENGLKIFFFSVGRLVLLDGQVAQHTHTNTPTHTHTRNRAHVRLTIARELSARAMRTPASECR